MENNRVCPASYSWGLILFLRGLFHNPAKILKGLIKEGGSAADLGCGPGFFTTAMSDMAGASGKVFAIDLQQEMLDKAKKRIERLCKNNNVTYIKAEPDDLNLVSGLDSALAFYMVHEVPDAEKFFKEVYSALKPGGKVLVVEPLFHISKQGLEAEKEAAIKAGFSLSAEKKTLFESTRLFEKKQ
jgi:ubiquinone/menaquinone biosynthesis C-methylase UbiE